MEARILQYCLRHVTLFASLLTFFKEADAVKQETKEKKEAKGSRGRAGGREIKKRRKGGEEDSEEISDDDLLQVRRIPYTSTGLS